MRKRKPVNVRVTRLRDFAAAVRGESDLKVGPASISLLLEETADHVERLTDRLAKARAKPAPVRQTGG